MAAFTAGLERVWASDHVEAMAALKALEVAESIGIADVIIEGGMLLGLFKPLLVRMKTSRLWVMLSKRSRLKLVGFLLLMPSLFTEVLMRLPIGQLKLLLLCLFFLFGWRMLLLSFLVFKMPFF